MKTTLQIIQENQHNDINLAYGKVVYINNKWTFVAPGEKLTVTEKRVERIKETDIQRGLRLVNMDEQYLTKLIKFLKRDKGQKLVNNFDRMPIDALIRRFQAPFAKHRKKVSARYNLVKSAIKISGVLPFFEDTHIVDYTHLLYDKQLKGDLKPHKNLTHGEQKNINKLAMWEIKLDKAGNPIIKTDEDGKLLYYSGSNNPVYKYTPRPNGLGVAMRMHLLEMHKMEKWDRLHPEPNEDDLKQDLFPNELLSGHRTARYIHLESVREFLANKYCHSVRKTPSFRVFEVYKPLPAQENYCEVERYSDAYCLSGLDLNTPNTTLKTKLEGHLKLQTSTPMGDQTVAWKVYDRDGNFRIRAKAA